MYIGEAAGGLFQGMHARDQLDLQQDALAAKRLLAMRESKNRQMENFLKLSEQISKNPIAGLEMVRGAGPDDLSDTHRAALLVRAHTETPDYMQYQQHNSKLTGLPGGAARYAGQPDARLYAENAKDEANTSTVREGLKLFPQDPTGFQRYLAMKNIKPEALDKYATSLYPEETAVLTGHRKFWETQGGKRGETAALDAPLGVAPGQEGVISPNGPSVTVGQRELRQKGLESRVTNREKIAGQYDHPLQVDLDQSLVELRRAQSILDRARLGQISREEVADNFKNLQRLAETLRTMNNYQFESRIFADPKRPAPVIDPQTGQTLADKIEATMAELAQAVNANPQPVLKRSDGVDQSRVLRGRAPAPVPPASQVPTRPNILDIKRID
jgi:hypothetical protein